MVASDADLQIHDIQYDNTHTFTTTATTPMPRLPPRQPHAPSLCLPSQTANRQLQASARQRPKRPAFQPNYGQIRPVCRTRPPAASRHSKCSNTSTTCLPSQPPPRLTQLQRQHSHRRPRHSFFHPIPRRQPPTAGFLSTPTPRLPPGLNAVTASTTCLPSQPPPPLTQL